MKFLVLGCNGMAGHLISLYLKENGHKVTGLARKKSDLVECVIADASDFDLLKRIITEGEYDAVINCIGVLNEFAESEKSRALLLNGCLPHFLAETLAPLPSKVVHISTDCVFSGKKGSYSESDFPDGSRFYDRSKAIGELNDKKNLTLRTSIVGPDINQNGIGILNWFMKQSGTVNGYTGAIWTGQTTLQLAKTIEQAIKCGATGLFNAVPERSINKYQLLTLFNQNIRKEPIIIEPSARIECDKSLVRTNFEGFSYRIPDYEIMIKELGEWMREHKSLYPHYDL